MPSCCTKSFIAEVYPPPKKITFNELTLNKISFPTPNWFEYLPKCFFESAFLYRDNKIKIFTFILNMHLFYFHYFDVRIDISKR